MLGTIQSIYSKVSAALDKLSWLGPLIIILIVAIVTARLPSMKSTLDFLEYAEFLFAIILFWLLVGGAGRVSLDAWLVRRKK